MLTLIAYHAGAAYFGMQWKLFFLGVIGLAWVFLMVVVARIFDSPQHAYTRELLGSIPLPDVEPGWLEDSAAIVSPQPQGSAA